MNPENKNGPNKLEGQDANVDVLVSVLPIIVAHGDGIHDDTKAIEAYIKGTANVVLPNGRSICQEGGTFLIKGVIDLRR